MSTAGHRYLVLGDLDSHRLRALMDNVECPSLSPDGTRIALKSALGGDPARGWRLSVLDLDTRRVTPLAETRSVDDQAAWIDQRTVAYALPRGREHADVWTVPADGIGTPRILIPDAASPSPSLAASSARRPSDQRVRPLQHRHRPLQLAHRGADARRPPLRHRPGLLVACVRRGCQTEGVLPGGLGVRRRAPGLWRRLERESHGDDPLHVMDRVVLHALAVNEENASISGAEVGCQGEVGSACAMAAAGPAEAMGGTAGQAENAAEIALEHHLGPYAHGRRARPRAVVDLSSSFVSNAHVWSPTL